VLLVYPAAIAIQAGSLARAASGPRKGLYTESLNRYSRSKVAAHPFIALRRSRLREGTFQVVEARKIAFDAAAFLASAGLGRRITHFKKKQPLFSQGEPADSIFYLQKGRASLTVVSKSGKEATIALISAGEFAGEESIAGAAGLRLATATAITACQALKIERGEILRVLHEEHAFSDLFLKFLLARCMRTQADLVDQLFNSSEKRLARILLLLAEFGKPGEPEPLIPEITQETLAEMIGTTRSRVSFFMNRFRKLGFIEYNGRIRVHRSLLNIVLHD
jgi:CRP/FNR family transcriptional regulator, cyclic AMP receptor protein